MSMAPLFMHTRATKADPYAVVAGSHMRDDRKQAYPIKNMCPGMT